VCDLSCFFLKYEDGRFDENIVKNHFLWDNFVEGDVWVHIMHLILDPFKNLTFGEGKCTHTVGRHLSIRTPLLFYILTSIFSD